MYNINKGGASRLQACSTGARALEFYVGDARRKSSMAMATEVTELRRQAGRGHIYGRQQERGESKTSRRRKKQAGRSGRQGRREEVREGDREGEDGRKGDANNWGEKE